jgi:hypothetical protein
MNSLRDTILKAKNEKEIDTLVEKFEKYEFASTNTKTKVKKAVKERLFVLSGNSNKTKNRKGKKNEKSNSRRK